MRHLNVPTHYNQSVTLSDAVGRLILQCLSDCDLTTTKFYLDKCHG
jgi:hypothetical protein